MTMTDCIHDLDPTTCSICNGRERRVRTVQSKPDIVITSRYDGSCGFCERSIVVGQRIGKTDDVWVHAYHFGDDL